MSWKKPQIADSLKVVNEPTEFDFKHLIKERWGQVIWYSARQKTSETITVLFSNRLDKIANTQFNIGLRFVQKSEILGNIFLYVNLAPLNLRNIWRYRNNFTYLLRFVVQLCLRIVSHCTRHVKYVFSYLLTYSFVSDKSTTKYNQCSLTLSLGAKRQEHQHHRWHASSVGKRKKCKLLAWILWEPDGRVYLYLV